MRVRNPTGPPRRSAPSSHLNEGRAHLIFPLLGPGCCCEVQLLTELDGFDTRNDGVLLLAATNRQDVLDPALCRAGRISRRVMVPLPDEKGRRDILLVHLRHTACQGGQEGKLAAAAAVAAVTPGFSGAELQNVVNEAALLAVREGEVP